MQRHPAANIPLDSHTANGQASVWMKRGITLLTASTSESLVEAISCFDRAIALRQGLPLDAEPHFRYGLAAGWMNRGDALTRLGRLSEALESHDAALKVLIGLPAAQDPRFRRRHAIARLNRGSTLELQNTPASLTEALEAFAETIALLEAPGAERGSEERRILAAARSNWSNVLLQRIVSGDVSPTRLSEVMASAQKALALVADSEKADVVAAEIGFKSRHILCRAAIQLLESGGTPPELDGLLAQVTDAVDDCMRLARQWEAAGVDQFRPLTTGLFRFGCLVYQSRQPHFLTEFLLENLDPAVNPAAKSISPAMHAAAVESLWRSLGELQREGFRHMNTPRFEAMLAQLRELRVTEERLLALRRQHDAA